MKDDAEGDVARSLTQLNAHLLAMGSETPAAIERVLSLLNKEEVQFKAAMLAVLSILPAEIDAGVMNAWIEGSAEPGGCRIVDPERGMPHGASGTHSRARRDHQRAEQKVKRLEADLVEARGEAERLGAVRDECEHRLRIVAFARIIAEMNRLLGQALAVGPLFTLLRAVSGYLQPDPESEQTLQGLALAEYQEHRNKRPQTSRRIVEGLDLLAGDMDVEIELHRLLLTFVNEHLEPIEREQAQAIRTGSKLSDRAKRVKRNYDKRRTSVRRGARVSDRHEVLAGIRRD